MPTQPPLFKTDRQTGVRRSRGGAAEERKAETPPEGVGLGPVESPERGLLQKPTSEDPSSSEGLSRGPPRLPHPHPSAESQGPPAGGRPAPRAQLQEDTGHSAAFVLKWGEGGTRAVSPPDGVAWLGVQVPQGRELEEKKSGPYPQGSSVSSSTEHREALDT